MPVDPGSILHLIGKLLSSSKLIYLVCRILVFGAAMYGGVFGNFNPSPDAQFVFQTILSLALGGIVAEYLPIILTHADKLENRLRLTYSHASLPDKQKALVGRALKRDRRLITTDLASGFDLRDRLPADTLQIFLQKDLGEINNGIFSFKRDYWKWLNKQRLKLIEFADEYEKMKSG